MTRDQDMPPQIKKAALTAFVVATAAITSYFMREHHVTLMIPPLAVVVLLYIPPKTPHGSVIRITALMVAMLAFNGSVLFGHGLTIPDSFPTEGMLPSFRAITKAIPLLSTTVINAAVIICWLNRPPMAKPQEARHDENEGQHGENDHTLNQNPEEP